MNPLINRVILVGRLTKDPDLRYTPNGVPVATATLAVNRSFSNQQGEREADFINIVAWRKQAENMANYVKKGHLVGIDGRLQTRNYENQEGQRVYVTEVMAESVQFMEPKKDGGNSGSGGSNYNNNRTSNQTNNQGSGGQGNYTRIEDDPFSRNGQTIDISDDDLPF